MPYCGRPSAGCQTCRKRKIKCDRAEPTCKNCAKAGWICHGYRNTIDLLFHDETLKVTERVKLSKEEPKSQHVLPPAIKKVEDNRSEPFKEIERNGTHRRQDSTPYPSKFPCPEAFLMPNLDELAIGFFFFYHVCGTPCERDAWKALRESECLLASIKALGSAGVTKSGSSLSSSRQAQLRYLDAINLTNKALKLRQEAKKDSTLLAVNLLGIFESVTGSQSKLSTWHNHVQGAAALLQYRGTEQFETAEGGRLFLQTATTLIVSCIRRRLPLPAYLLELVAKAADYVPDPEDPAWVGFCLNIRFTNLYAKLLPNNLLRSTDEAESIIKEALILDWDIRTLLENSSEDWQPVKLFVDDGPMVFAGYIHVFREYFVAQHYNSFTNKRILLQDMMRKAFIAVPDGDSLNLSTSALQTIYKASQTIYQLQLDVLATIPQHLGLLKLETLAPFMTSLQKVDKDNLWMNFIVRDRGPFRSCETQNPGLPFLRLMGGLTTHWILYVIGRVDVPDGKVRPFAIKTLRILGHKFGVQQAFLLANSLENESAQPNAQGELSGEVKG